MGANLRTDTLRSAGLALLFFALPALSQTDRTAAFVQGGSAESGRCTVALSVDRSAELSVMGARGEIHSVTGDPAVIENMECTSPMPRNMADFQVRTLLRPGVTRSIEPNEVQLLEDPRSNGGNAVVRVHQPFEGPGEYMLELSWSGVQGVQNSFAQAFTTSTTTVNTTYYGYGDGNGHFRSRNMSERLIGVTVNSDGERLRVSFNTRGGPSIELRGRIENADANHIVADMHGEGADGQMLIRLNDAGRVREVTMSTSGRNGVDLRWHY